MKQPKRKASIGEQIIEGLEEALNVSTETVSLRHLARAGSTDRRLRVGRSRYYLSRNPRRSTIVNSPATRDGNSGRQSGSDARNEPGS